MRTRQEREGKKRIENLSQKYRPCEMEALRNLIELIICFLKANGDRKWGKGDRRGR